MLEDVENIILKLLQAADYNVESTREGVYIDEVDKISRKFENPSNHKSVSGEGVQRYQDNGKYDCQCSAPRKKASTTNFAVGNKYAFVAVEHCWS